MVIWNELLHFLYYTTVFFLDFFWGVDSISVGDTLIIPFKSDKLMDALFQEGQSAPQTPQTLFDADFEGLASNAEVYIFNQDDSQE